jgi:Domain of unknown function (DUF4260)
MSDAFANSSPAVATPVVWWLRLEAGGIAVLSAILYARTGASWWWFAALWLVPDLAMLGYLVNPRIGAFCYNAVHSYLLLATLASAGLLSHQALALPFALIWFNHISVDRFLGYGLKYPAGFGFTHLQGPSKAGKLQAGKM